PLAEVVKHEDAHFNYFGVPTPVRRGMLEVVFDSEWGRWHLFNLHLKSRRTVRADDPGSLERRVGEAEALRDRIRERLAATPGRLLVVGDFNDSTDSRALARFRQVNDRPLLEMVPCADSRGETWT